MYVVCDWVEGNVGNMSFGDCHILTLMKILDILELHDILWVQEKIEPIVVFC